MKILVSNNSQILKHLSSASFRHFDLQMLVATSGSEAVTKAVGQGPSLCILDAEMADLSGYQATIDIKQSLPHTRVVLVLGPRVNAAQMRLVADCGADEALVTPVEADHLYDVLALQLGMRRRGAERYSIALAAVTSDGARTIAGRVTNLSTDGARLLLEQPMAEGSRIRLDITPELGPAIAVDARVVWAQSRDRSCVVGAEFSELAPEIRSRLARLTLWDVTEEADGLRVVIKGDITEATRFEELLPILKGKVRFDLSNLGYMNSLGVRDWVEMLNKAKLEGCELHACAVGFVLQAALVEGVTKGATVVSFFAPYACEQCEHAEERLLQSAAILANEDRMPPVFACPVCDGLLELDDIPSRYLAFLPS